MKKGFVFVLYFLCSANVFAESDKSIEYSATFNNLSVNDPNGSTESVTKFSPYHVAWVSKLGRDTRYRAEIYYTEFKLSASTVNIGQEVTQLDFSASYQKRFNISRSIHPYIGIGLSYSQFESIARHKVDSSGFLTSIYPDRSEDLIYLLLSTDFEFEINKTFDVGFKLQHREPFGDGVTDSSVGVSLIYKL